MLPLFVLQVSFITNTSYISPSSIYSPTNFDMRTSLAGTGSN